MRSCTGDNLIFFLEKSFWLAVREVEHDVHMNEIGAAFVGDESETRELDVIDRAEDDREQEHTDTVAIWLLRELNDGFGVVAAAAAGCVLVLENLLNFCGFTKNG